MHSFEERTESDIVGCVERACRRPSAVSRYEAFHHACPHGSDSLLAAVGFTLLEIIVVIFVISLMLAIAVPSFTRIGESGIESEAKRLASILRYLNDTAISTKDDLHFKANLGEKTISYKEADGEKSESFENLAGIVLQSKGAVADGEVIVFFGPTGAGESFSFVLRDEKKTLAVALNAVSGRVRISEEER